LKRLHTGFSPLYNGADTISFAFANGHIGLCGGTLMVINDRVDGGDILAHYLPAIEPEDTPVTISMRIFAAVPRIYLDFLKFMDGAKPFSRCVQPPPLFYFRGRDWTIVHAQTAQRHIRNRLAARYQRSEQYIKYWEYPGDTAYALLRSTVDQAIGLTI